MTNEEAIKAIKDNYPTSGYYILREALDMAIEALENIPPENSICYGCHDDCDNCESMAMMMI